MPNIVNFTLLADEYMCSPISNLELLSGTQFDSLGFTFKISSLESEQLLVQ